MSNDDEADRIVEKLKRTDAEREAEIIEMMEKYVAEFAAMVKANSIDEENIRKIQSSCLNKIEELYPELKK